MSVMLSGADVIDLAVQTEVRGETFYRQAAEMVDGQQARDLFIYLADEEVRHKRTFEGLDASIVMTEYEGADWQDAADYVAATVQSEFFGQDAAIREVPEGATTLDMVRQAIGFEKQTLLFFHTLRDLVHPANRPIIDEIIAEERRHVVRLAGYADKLAA